MHIFQPDRYLLRRQVQAVGKYIQGRTLDIGAGERNRYGDLFTAGEYITMDIKEGANVSIVGSIEDIPAADNSFDSLVCTQVLEHVPHPVKAVSEMYRVLKPGGYAVITVPQMNELHEEPHDYFRYTNFGMEQLFNDAGFTVIEKSQRGGFYATRAQMNIRYAIDRYHLYARPVVGWLFGKYYALYGRAMIARDARNPSVANRKHALGWCYTVKK